MKFNFKIQQYQTDAVDAVISVFNGQPYLENRRYIRDLGGKSTAAFQTTLDSEDYNPYDDTGYRNAAVELTETQILKNIQNVQNKSNIKTSTKLENSLGACSLDIEMETGTGKTYVYIKTIFELNQTYGWSKFIIVVPSIAIREGVKKSFEITADHFMEYYHKKVRFFIYSSTNLTELDKFAASGKINVMIINTQAFASSLKENGNSKESRIIYSERDEFGSRKPIDVISATHPILILDEPQKMGGTITQKALKNFHPLFTLNYSATHTIHHNTVYVLDALDAFNHRLVKKIEVKGFEVKNLLGTGSYLYLEQIILSPKHPPKAKIELEVSRSSGIKRETHILSIGDDLYYTSQNLEQYKGYIISDINPIQGTVTFTNGQTIYTGDITGDISEQNIRKIQIRETILSHFEKEKNLYEKGIKTLSLFFIDEVAKYRQYDDNGNEILGEYGKIFETEYARILEEYITTLDNSPYYQYLTSTCKNPSAVHNGYFSIDKKTGRSINSSVKRGNEFSDDTSAYDLILKKKEQLLSFEEPTRFIFSHSALREGWDNPNIFQICTLKHSDSQTAKRQEVGRGLRLCVDIHGNRMDAEYLGETVHDINLLTVIASESYKEFVAGLQSDIKSVLSDRPSRADSDYFKGKYINVNGTLQLIDKKTADDIEYYLIKNDYIDRNRKVTDKYRADKETGTLALLPQELLSITDGVHTLIQAVYDDTILDNMFSDGHETKIRENPINENFAKKEFQELWKRINHKYAYTVEFDSNELIQNAAAAINQKLSVGTLTYLTTTAQQKSDITASDIKYGTSFDKEKTRRESLLNTEVSQVKYDLIGKIADGTILTRKTISSILQKLTDDKFAMFKNNPEEFISKVTQLIKEQKATMIVEHITYNQIEREYDCGIFTADKNTQSLDKAFKAKKAIQDYIFTDGFAENSVERRFAEELDAAEEVCVYVKLPRSFHIPTPVGNYSPDWAIAFHTGTVKHIFFIAETKGSMNSMNLKPIEDIKIKCAKKLFNEMSTSKVKYHEVDSYQTLLKVMKTL